MKFNWIISFLSLIVFSDCETAKSKITLDSTESIKQEIWISKRNDFRYNYNQKIQNEKNYWEIDMRMPNDSGKDSLKISGLLLDTDGSTPMSNIELWIYHADENGYYNKTSDGTDKGWRHSIYSERARTGPEGQFEIITIRPGGYPDSEHPEHIHIRIKPPRHDEQEHSIYFKDSPRYSKMIINLDRQYPFLYIKEVDAENRNKVSWQIRLLEHFKTE